MDPFTASLLIGGGSQILGGGLGYLLGGLDDEAYLDELRKTARLYDQYQPASLTYTPFTPERFSYETIKEAPELRQKQLDYLQKLSGLSETGLSAEDEQSLARLQEQTSQQARGGREALIQQAQARGQGGSGLSLALQEQANQEALQRGQMAGLGEAAQRARQRALYTQAYGQGLGGLREQDLGVAGRNTDIINQFNQMNTQARNLAALGNIEREQDIRQRNIANRQGWLAGRRGTGQDLAQGLAASGAAKMQRLQGLAGGLLGGLGQMGLAGMGYGADLSKLYGWKPQ